jgi:malate dehydrogenase (oxaloacetate-decarboxylating)
MSPHRLERPAAPAPQPDIAYTLDLVVADRLRAVDAANIARAAPGPVRVHREERPSTGVTRIRLVAADEATLRWLKHWLRVQLGGALLDCVDPALDRSRGGKTRTVAAVPLEDVEDLAFAYTPGVGRVATAVAANAGLVRDLTGKINRVAVVTDGSAVLGLGDLGPAAALPVMEGKAALFARLAGIDAVPICLDVRDTDAVVAAVCAIAPGFGGINLEDIAAPRCFDIETRLRASLDIPVLHDDQHGTAVVVLAALLNALAVTGRDLRTARIVVLGAGAAGTAVSKLLLAAGAGDLTVWAPVGVLHSSIGPQLPAHKQELAALTNPRRVRGGLADALRDADVAIGVSAAGVLDRRVVATMNTGPIVFALANPVPEVEPAEIADIAAVIATGRSDHPNQVNNALAFPGLFRGALDAGLRRLDTAALLASAKALSGLVAEPAPQLLLPGVLDPRVVPAVAAAVAHSTAGHRPVSD